MGRPRVIAFKHLHVNLNFVTHVADMVEERDYRGLLVRQDIVVHDGDYEPMSKDGVRLYPDSTIEKAILVSEGQNYQHFLKGEDMDLFLHFWKDYHVNLE